VGRWRERQRSYPGRPVGYAKGIGNLYREIQPSQQESAEAIVLLREEGLNMKRGKEPMSSTERRRKQKIPKGGCPEPEAMNTEKVEGAPSFSGARIGDDPHGEEYQLMEKVVERENMKAALKRVERNKGAPGIDGRRTEELKAYLSKNWSGIKEMLLNATYKPTPVRRVEIPKPDGGKRTLGIPIVVDRLIQQALLQVLTPIFDPGFSDSSYGFRPQRSAHQAVRRARSYTEEGYEWVADIDLEKFFDKVNHDMLMARVARKVKDKRVLRLIRAYFTVGIMTEGVVVRVEAGTPQGGPVSPLLANILLDDLDKELEKRGHKFVRYADDCNIYVRSERAGKRVMESVGKFVEKKLRLKVNRKKSGVDKTHKRKILGFSFYGVKRPRIRFASKTLQRFKERVRKLTRRTWGISTEERLEYMNRYFTGWINYFHLVDTPGTLERLDKWIRKRLRMCILKQWKEPKTRRRKLIILGVPREEVHLISASRRGCWHLANCKWVNIALGPSYWKELGLISLAERYSILRGVS